ncbi:hypothetical protein CS8_025890 [Cupriavidus sp. 8B]
MTNRRYFSTEHGVAGRAEPVNVLMGLQGVRLSLDELAGLGVKRVSVGGSLARAAFGAFLRAAHEMCEHGTFGYNDDAIPSNDVNALFAQAMRALPRCA